MQNKRGLSPVIATVLLVGLVVVSGLIIFMWFRGFIQEAGMKNDQNIQLVCNDVQFDASYSDVTGDLAIKNIGSVPIYGFKVITSGPGGHDTKDLSELRADWDDENDGLVEGEATLVNVGGLQGDITLIPILLGTTQKGAQASFACDEKLYGREISF
ncbi:hypothetical protein HYT25_02380 [Candidatus Pacearchaeota archaeon]|nr:hypothetical protein [Candidatus Pacearchaeota archaeon]